MTSPAMTSAALSLLPSGEKAGRVTGSDEGDADFFLIAKDRARGHLPRIRHAPHDTFSPQGRRNAFGQ